jgi:hypothetical protein
VSEESPITPDGDLETTGSVAGPESTEIEPPEPPSTVGTGSYIAISCTVIALLVTFGILGILFLLRWL